MLTILGALLALWHHFWAQLRHLGVTFGAFWKHFLCQKTDWGAKGAQRGATPVSNSPFWMPCWSIFLDLSGMLNKKSCVLHVLVFSMHIGLHWALFGIGSHAIRPRICSPNTLFSFCIFFLKSLPEDLQMSHCLSIFWPNMWFLCEKMGSKNCFKKRCPSRLKRESINRPGASRRGSLTYALYKQETVVWAAVEALFEIFAEKSGLGWKLVWKNDWTPEL